jgi:hypothetical protein
VLGEGVSLVIASQPDLPKSLLLPWAIRGEREVEREVRNLGKSQSTELSTFITWNVVWIFCDAARGKRQK